MDEYYEMFHEIRQRKIDPKQICRDYGKQTAFYMNSKCPIVIKHGGLALDELADEMKMSTDELYEMIMNYKPKYKWEREIKNYHECEEDSGEVSDRWLF